MELQDATTKVEAIAASRDVDEVLRSFRAAIEPHGFNASACGYFRPTLRGAISTFFFQDWPEEWIRIYTEGNFVNHDYGVAEARKRIFPFTWSEVREGRDLSPGEKRIWQAALDFGWNEGFSVPVHGPGGYFGLVTMAGKVREYSTGLRLFLQVIGLAVHKRCLELSQKDVPDELPQGLTSRELECLRWVASGIPDAAIANKLGISATTVKDYISTARRKINASTRAQAVAMIMTAGLM